MRQRRWLMLIVLLLVSSFWVPGVLAASDLTWNRTDVDIQINADGTLTVTAATGALTALVASGKGAVEWKEIPKSKVVK